MPGGGKPGGIGGISRHSRSKITPGISIGVGPAAFVRSGAGQQVCDDYCSPNPSCGGGCNNNTETWWCTCGWWDDDPIGQGDPGNEQGASGMSVVCTENMPENNTGAHCTPGGVCNNYTCPPLCNPDNWQDCPAGNQWCVNVCGGANDIGCNCFGMMLDCDGNCAPSDWCGDGVCDDGSFQDCSQAELDDGTPLWCGSPNFSCHGDAGDCP